MMIPDNPHMLPKLRSKKLRDACRDMPCCARVAGFWDAACAGPDTVVGAHLPILGKGTGTKSSDLAIVAACFTCHELIDGRSCPAFPLESEPELRMVLAQIHHKGSYWKQLMRGNHETIARWIAMGLLPIPEHGTLIS